MTITIKIQQKTEVIGPVRLIKNNYKTAYYFIFIMLCIGLILTVSRADELNDGRGFVGENKVVTPEIYTIYNISMDETASTSSVARIQAVKKVQRLALNTLFLKIIRDADMAQLPTLSDDQITEFVGGFEIANEKSSHTRYLADFTVYFNRDKIYTFLSARKIAFAETLSNPVNILAVIEKEGASVLWQNENDWRDAWVKYDTINNLVPIVIMKPSLANRMAITAWQAQQGDKQFIQNFADLQGVRKVYIMSARLEDDLAYGKKSLLVKIFSNDDSQYEFRTMVEDNVSGTISEEDYLNLLYNQAIKQASYWLDNQWKNKVMVHYGSLSKLNVTITYDKSDNWFGIKKKLESLSLVRNITYKNIMISQTEAEIEHSGDAEQMILALDQENLILMKQPDKSINPDRYHWVISLKK